MLKTIVYEIHPYDCQQLAGQTVFIAVHNLGTQNILCTLSDPNGEVMNGSNMFTLTDDTVTVNIAEATFQGTYKFVIYYENGSSQYSKKKLFEQPLISYSRINEFYDYRLAIGKKGAMTQNVTIEDFKNGLSSSNLPYLSNNPVNWNFTLVEQLAAQQKLNVYSKALIDNMYSSAYPVTGVIDTISSFTRNTTNISTDPSFSNTVHPGGVHISMAITATASELNTSTGTNIGSFKITPLSVFDIDSNSGIYASGMVIDGNGVLRGICKVELNPFVNSDNDIVVPVLISTNSMSFAKTIYFSIDLPVMVTSINS